MTFDEFSERLRQDFKEYLDLYPGSDLASLLRNDNLLEAYFELFELSEQPEHGIYPLFLTDKQTTPEASDHKPEFYPTKHRIETTQKYIEQFTEDELELLEAIKEDEELRKEYEIKLGEYLKEADRIGRPPDRLTKALLILYRPKDKGGRPTEHEGFYRTVRLLQLHLEKRGVKRPHRKIADYLTEINRLTDRPGTDRDKLHEIIRKVPQRINIGDKRLIQEARNEYKQFCQDFNIPYHNPFLD